MTPRTAARRRRPARRGRRRDAARGRRVPARARLPGRARRATRPTALASAGAAQRPDLVILDLGLPDADGSVVIRRMRREATTPIVVLSARDREADKVAALEAGADDYVTKPFGAAELLARVRARPPPGGRAGGGRRAARSSSVTSGSTSRATR